MGGNRKSGFLYGNKNGRNGSNKVWPWPCAGCQKDHGGKTFKNGYKGALYCDRQYFKLKSLEVTECENLKSKINIVEKL